MAEGTRPLAGGTRDHDDATEVLPGHHAAPPVTIAAARARATTAPESAHELAEPPIHASSVGRAAADYDHVANVARLRQLVGFGAVLWLGALGVDAFVVRVGERPLSYFFTVRALTAVVFVLAALRLSPTRLPSPRALRVVDQVIFGVAMLGTVALALGFGGIASPYAHVGSVALVVRGLALPDHWKTTLARTLHLPLVFPLGMAALAMTSPALAAQFSDDRALGAFLVNTISLLCSWMLMAMGGHWIWMLRRQVFEARMIGRYRLVKRIGRGGMGEVWQAYHPALRRDVAVKILRSQHATEDNVVRFEREIRAMTGLAHPNTVRIFDCGVTDDGLWFYAMELLAGETLGALVKREGPLAPARAVWLVRQAARALAEAHQQGIVHRDVKPENLFVTTLGGEADFVKVLDFGIARIAEQAAREDGEDITSGLAIGTLSYMAPEQASAGWIDARTDVYGLGAVLHFALTGAPPFERTSLRDVAFAPRPTVPSTITPAPLDPRLDAIVMRCLEPEPQDRYANARVLNDALAQLDDAM